MYKIPALPPIKTHGPLQATTPKPVALSSHETLDYFSQVRPPKKAPLRVAAGTMIAAGLAATAFGATAPLGLLSAFVGAAYLYLDRDWTPVGGDREFYYHLEGITDHPSFLDRIFGYRIHAVDDPQELVHIPKGDLCLINNFSVTSKTPYCAPELSLLLGRFFLSNRTSDILHAGKIGNTPFPDSIGKSVMENQLVELALDYPYLLIGAYGYVDYLFTAKKKIGLVAYGPAVYRQ